jgi:hypothetical protein
MRPTIFANAALCQSMTRNNGRIILEIRDKESELKRAYFPELIKLTRFPISEWFLPGYYGPDSPVLCDQPFHSIFSRTGPEFPLDRRAALSSSDPFFAIALAQRPRQSSLSYDG